MLFHEIGALLKNKREEMAINQEDIANKLKIPLRSIVALEDGDLDELPHEVYIRTFLKGYANYLGFSAEEISTIFSDIDDFKVKNEPPKSLEAKRAENNPEAVKSKSVRFIIQLLLVALLGASAYFYYAKNGRSEAFSFQFLTSWFTSDDSESTASPHVDKNNDAELKEKAAEEKAKKDKEAEDKESEKSSSFDDSDKSTPVDANAPGEITESNAVEVTEEMPDIELKDVEPKISEIVDVDALKAEDISQFEANPADMEDLATFIAQTPEAIVINWDILSEVKEGQEQAVIYVTRDCWMQVVIDGKSTHFTLKRGSQREFLFKNKLQFKIGNASAVTLFHNRNLVDVGDSSVLRTVTLQSS